MLQGFVLHENGHDCKEGGCKHEISAAKGEISSPHYPDYYPAKKVSSSTWFAWSSIDCTRCYYVAVMGGKTDVYTQFAGGPRPKHNDRKYLLQHSQSALNCRDHTKTYMVRL